MQRFTSILLTAVIVSLIWMVAVQDAKRKQLTDIEKSVINPTLGIISDLNQTLKQGDYELLEKKMDRLEKYWSKLASRMGPRPVIFMEEIQKLK